MIYIFRNIYIFDVGSRMLLSRDLRRTSSECVNFECSWERVGRGDGKTQGGIGG